MGGALVRGIIRAGLAEAADVVVHDTNGALAEALALDTGVAVAASNGELAQRARTIVIAVKPQHIHSPLAALAREWRPHHVLVSVCAGLTCAFFEERLASREVPAPRVVRTMPNTPAMIGAGAAGVAAGAHALAADTDAALALLRAVGIAEVLPESVMDAVTATAGSGPAYVFRLIEAMIAGAVAQGIPPQEAERLVKQTVMGAARLALEGTQPVADLRRAVTSPGGTTQAGLAVLDGRDFMGIVAECIAAATRRGAELSAAASQATQHMANGPASG
jgi:pyrroline-5-carboxylate reductase